MPTPGQLKKSKKGSEVDRVYSLLKEKVLNCDFYPSDFLVEMDVAEQCHTSRTPVREACNRLAEEKWLTKIQNKGYLVTPILIRDIIEIYEYRRILECFGAERVAQDASAEEISLLKRIVAVEDRPAAKRAELIKANQEFHASLGRMARNHRVYDELLLTLEYIHRLDILSTQRDREWVGHSTIMSALEMRDAAAARNAMSEHIDRSQTRMLRIFRGQKDST
jgi:GntR family transcriptional regulator, rspAB operon transcriptional repressor